MDYSNEGFDIIIQAGQSNSDGTGFGPVDAEYVPKENVLYMTDVNQIAIAEERRWNQDEWPSPTETSKTYTRAVGDLSLTFADEYINNARLEPGRKLLIIRGAVGGTGFLDNRWNDGDDLNRRLMAMIYTALELSPANRAVAFLWHQGETDAGLKASYATHYSNLAALVNRVRSAAKYPYMPFVAGDLVQDWAEAFPDICRPVVNAMRDFCKNTHYGHFVDTHGLTSNNAVIGDGDTIHFSRPALYELGRRYYAAFAYLVKLLYGG